MFVALRLIDLGQGHTLETSAVLRALQQASGSLATPLASWAAPVVEGATIHCGQIVWRLHFLTEVESLEVELDPVWRDRIAPLLAQARITTVGYRSTWSEVRRTASTIWRALIFRVAPPATPGQAQQLENELMLMPRYIERIGSWSLSRVAYSIGPKAFTHVWEQEFTDLAALRGDYMMHPVHWARVDSWFDADCPNYIVDPQLIQVVAPIDGPVIASL